MTYNLINLQRIFIENNNSKYHFSAFMCKMNQKGKCMQTAINLQITEFQHRKKCEIRSTVSFNNKETQDLRVNMPTINPHLK